MKTMIKKALVTAAAATVLGGSGQAVAEVYSVAKLDITDLAVVIDVGSAFGYTFTTSAEANLNNTGSDADSKTCGDDGSIDACSNLAPVLTSVANGTGGTVTRLAGDTSTFGFGSGETYANAAAEIGEAQLATGNLTDTSQISEVELQGTGVGTAETTISSRTTFSISFSVGPNGSVNLSFDAAVLLDAYIDTPEAFDGFGATGKVDTIFTLSGANTLVNWRANGSNTTSPLEFADCTGAVCAESADSHSLNTQRTLDGTTNPDTGNRFSESGNYAIAISGLAQGGYTLTLTAQTFSDAQQRVRVPAPGVLSLMGIGLAGLGLGFRRRKAA